MDLEKLFWNFLAIAGMVLLSLAACLGTFSAFKSAMADGQIQYCWVRYYSPQGMAPIYELWGFRPWREDREIAKFPTVEEAVKASELMKCPLRVEGK